MNTWRRRIFRLRRRIGLASDDLQRSAAWYAGGGRRFFDRYSPDLISGHKWCFVVGCNNSGTSLLQSMFDLTGKVSTFETEGQFYTRVLPRAERRGFERVWMEYEDKLRVSAASHSPRECAARLAHDWLNSLALPIRQIVVEKTPANALRMEWLQAAFPQSYFIGLVRNGYAVSEGIRRKGHKPLARGAAHWNSVNRTLLEDANRVDRFKLIRYEDVVDRYDAVMQEIVEFLDIRENVAGSPSGSSSSIRQDHRVLKNFNSESIARLSEDDRGVIRDNAAEMLDYFEYTCSGSNVDNQSEES